MNILLKCWFAFIFCCIIATWVGLGYVGYQAYQAGPEGLGKLVGQFLNGVKQQ